MNSILAQTNFLSARWNLLFLGLSAVLVLVFLIIVFNFGMVYIRALFSGAKVTFTELIALRLRGVPVGLIVDSRITAVKFGPPITIDDLSTHYLAGGSIQMVVLADRCQKSRHSSHF